MKKAYFITSEAEIKYNEMLTAEEEAHSLRRKELGTDGFNSLSMELTEDIGLLCFKKNFSLSEMPVKATLRATALGVYDLFLNGKRVGTSTENGTVYDELKPEWTDYRFRVLEHEYDVTALLQEENTVVAVVSEGWWRGRISYGVYGKKPRAFCGEIEMAYKDGRDETVSSDTDWASCHGGRIRTASIWDGEYFDATYPDMIDDPDAYGWSESIKADYADMKIEKYNGTPVRVRPELDQSPKSATVHCGVEDNGSTYGKIKVVSKRVGKGCEKCVLKKGETLLLDMAQETVGCPEINVRAARGTKITVAFAELLNDSGSAERGNDGAEGSVYVKNYRSALSRMVYVAAGDGDEVYRSTHTFYGYRYLSITADGDITVNSVIGKVIGSVLEELGSFETSSSEVNKLYSNIVWGMRSNYLSVPTDCPQRDERLGWSGDTQVFIGAASYIADTRDFMHKWMTDARYSQVGFNGAFGSIIPRVFTAPNHAHAYSSCAWSDAGIIVPYKIWKMFGDRAILEANFDAIEEYMANVASEGHEGPRAHYGDWLSYEPVDRPYLSLAYYVYDITMMIDICRALKKRERAEYYKALRAEIVQKFTDRYVVNGEITVKAQTAYLLALAFDIVSGQVRKTTVRQLRDRIRDNGYRLATGFVGTGVLNQTLSKVGLHDTAYSLLTQFENPSWLYSLRQGATTIWERWNSYTHEKGFGDVTMNSFNHYAYGAVAEWMYSYMAGICPDEKGCGFKHFTLRPTPDNRKRLPAGQERITFARATYNSVNGLIESAWYKEQGRTVYRFTVPENTDARVELIDVGDIVSVNGVDFTLNELGAFKTGGRTVFRLGSGKYEIK